MQISEGKKIYLKPDGSTYGPGETIRFGSRALPAPTGPRDWPDAIEFLRWLLGDEPRLDLQHYRSGWSWERTG